jgi:integrase/recombinase XerD
MKEYIAKAIVHKGEKRIQFIFNSNKDLVLRIRKIPGRTFSGSLKCWHIPYSKKNLEEFKAIDFEVTKVNKRAVILHDPLWASEKKKVRKHQTEFIKRNISLEEYKKYLHNKRYSKNTIETYTNAVKGFFTFLMKRPEEITHQDFMDYNYRCIVEQGHSRSLQNAIISGLKLYFRKFSNNQIDMELLERPNKSRKLPVVLSKEEVKSMIESTTNLKHRTILSLVYSSGLRMSELLGLTVNDIDSSRMVICILQAKGFKDRTVPLSEKILELLRQYYKAYRPKEYLIEGINGKQYSPESVGRIVKRAAKKVGITKRVTTHTLRHSYATHLLESGVDLRYIQVLLGHNSSRTTEIYTHVSNYSLSAIKSPYDQIMEPETAYRSAV